MQTETRIVYDIRNEGRAILIDCGEGTQIQIMKLGWGFRCIEAVLLTHYHADHCSGLPGFLLAQAKAGRTEPLPVWGQSGSAGSWTGCGSSVRSCRIV